MVTTRRAAALKAASPLRKQARPLSEAKPTKRTRGKAQPEKPKTEKPGRGKKAAPAVDVVAVVEPEKIKPKRTRATRKPTQLVETVDKPKPTRGKRAKANAPVQIEAAVEEKPKSTRGRKAKKAEPVVQPTPTVEPLVEPLVEEPRPTRSTRNSRKQPVEPEQQQIQKVKPKRTRATRKVDAPKDEPTIEPVQVPEVPKATAHETKRKRNKQPLTEKTSKKPKVTESVHLPVFKVPTSSIKETVQVPDSVLMQQFLSEPTPKLHEFIEKHKIDITKQGSIGLKRKLLMNYPIETNREPKLASPPHFPMKIDETKYASNLIKFKNALLKESKRLSLLKMKTLSQIEQRKRAGEVDSSTSRFKSWSLGLDWVIEDDTRHSKLVQSEEKQQEPKKPSEIVAELVSSRIDIRNMRQDALLHAPKFISKHSRLRTNLSERIRFLKRLDEKLVHDREAAFVEYEQQEIRNSQLKKDGPVKVFALERESVWACHDQLIVRIPSAETQMYFGVSTDAFDCNGRVLNFEGVQYENQPKGETLGDFLVNHLTVFNQKTRHQIDYSNLHLRILHENKSFRMWGVARKFGESLATPLSVGMDQLLASSMSLQKGQRKVVLISNEKIYSFSLFLSEKNDHFYTCLKTLIAICE